MTSYKQVEHLPVEFEANEEIAKQFKKYQSSSKFNLNSEEIFCICRKPDLGGQLMIGCDGCDEWYHFKCMKINELYKNLISKFYCKFCQWQGKGFTQWKRKCLVDDCWNPISIENDVNSKFCSKSCGIKYFSSLVKDHANADKIATLVNYCKSKEDFSQLGNRFPEIIDINSIDSQKASFDKLPADVKSKLETINGKITRLNEDIAAATIKVQLLSSYKELMKSLNDKLSGTTEITSKSKAKNNKSKRIELCLCNKQLKHVTQDLIDDVRNNIDTIIQHYHSGETTFQDICLNERRKCPRHNGWYNLMHDQVIKSIAQFETELNELSRQKSLLIREYSISVYETREAGSS